MTNFERIKAMSVEELVNEFVYGFRCRRCNGDDFKIPCGANCKEQFAKWLNAEVKEGEKDE